MGRGLRLQPLLGKESLVAAIIGWVTLSERKRVTLSERQRLGGDYAPNTAGQLNVEVGVADTTEPMIVDSLAGTADEVRVGLPAEYANAVLSGVNLLETEPNKLSAGKLRINCAAHGAKSSCDAIYKHLAIILIKLLNFADDMPSDDDLIALFPSTFS